MRKVLVPSDVFTTILKDRSKRKLFVTYTLLRLTMNFPAAFTASEKRHVASIIKKTNRTIDNYMKIAIDGGVLIKEGSKYNLITEWQLFRKLYGKFKTKPFIIIDFNLLKPHDSLLISVVSIFLEKQEHVLKQNILKICGDVNKVEALYGNHVDNFENIVYYPGVKNLPPLLTQENIAEMCGLKSASSGYYKKKKLIKLGIIQVKKMKKRKVPSSHRRFPLQYVKRNPPDIAILSDAKKKDSTLISLK